MHGFSQILTASIGGGIGLGILDYWRRYKAKRRALPAGERNAGFWTDGRILAVEIAVAAAIYLPLLYIILAFYLTNYGVQLPFPW